MRPLFRHRLGRLPSSPWRPPLHPPRGAYLGDFKDELDAGDHIIQFCSGDTKNYGYRTKNGRVMCKVSGFSLKGRRECSIELRRLASKHLGRMTLSFRQTSHHTRHAISHHPKKSQDYTLETRPSHKDYHLVYSKRVLEPIKAYLYGYECLTDENLDLADVLADLFG